MKNKYKIRKKQSPRDGRRVKIEGQVLEKYYRNMGSRSVEFKDGSDNRWVYVVMKSVGSGSRPVLCRGIDNEKYDKILKGDTMRIIGTKYPHQKQGVIVLIEFVELV